MVYFFTDIFTDIMRKTIAFLLTLLLCTATGICRAQSDAGTAGITVDADALLEYCRLQTRQTLLKTANDSCARPRCINLKDTDWYMVNIYDWTSGFWPGILWYNYEAAPDEGIREMAVRYTECLSPLTNLQHDCDHDIGFQVMSSFGHAYRQTKNEAYRTRILEGAEKLSRLYNPTVGTILSWPGMVQRMGWPHNTILDNMMNLEILFFASKNGGKREWYDMAVSHARVTMENQFRPDGTSYHVAVYDTVTGKFIKGVTNQGYGDETFWARGQAWSVYGYTMVYRETGDVEFLRFAEKLADTYLRRLPEDGVPFWDFDDPAIPNAPKDASAAAITASALLELSQLEDDRQKARKYEAAAVRMLNSLSSASYRCSDGKSAFLLHSTGNYPGGYEIDASLIYADYYYIEALVRYKKIRDGRTSLSDKVDLFMGVQGASNCVIGPQWPHGSVNPAPHTPRGHHDGYDPGQPIRGFAQLHVSGAGWGRYGQLLLSPQTGFNSNEDGHDSPKSEEVATPYYYAVHLDRYGIRTEITPTHHCALYRITFPQTSRQSNDANILLDLAHNIPQHIAPEIKGRFIGGNISYDKRENALSGWGEYAGGFGSDRPYKVWFYMQPDVSLDKVRISDRKKGVLYARLQLPENVGTVRLDVGVSFQSVENARRFLAMEVAQKSFDEVKSQAKEAWENVLSSIEVRGGTDEAQRLFYTTLYHSFLMPRDRTGDKPGEMFNDGNDSRPHLDDHYCVWDTWRTKYPLMTLIQESFTSKTIQSFLSRFAADSICNPTYTSSLEWDWKQGGDDVDNIIADAFAKKVPGFDRQAAYELLKYHAFNARNHSYLQYGWLPETGERMSCSYTMEYAYNDFCASQVARYMQDAQTAAFLAERSGKWEKLFNAQAESHGFKGFVLPRSVDNEWVSIDPAKKYGSWESYFYEGNSWVYTLFTPHQFDRLIDLCGGKKAMTDRLVYGFDNGLIDMENEPGFLTPFIFMHCGRPDLAAKYVRRIRENHFSLSAGYPDNEDSGAMGAWYVFTSIGLFPNAGQDFYYLLPPAFPEITLTRENGKRIRITTEKSSPDAQYVESISLNGRILDTPRIRHEDMADGANIVFKLTTVDKNS
jgi:predicted alpha-1,2-mannosidase